MQDFFTQTGIPDLRTAEKRKADMHELVEVTRSFSYKLNAGNYESRDFFCSQKAECKPEEVEAVSDRLYQFCKQEVIKSIKDWRSSTQLTGGQIV
jgi:hypothetical protein